MRPKTKFTLKEEIVAILRYQLTSDEKSRELIFKQYQHLVHMCATRIYSRSKKTTITYEDLISEGFCGLMKALQKHNVFRCDKLYPTANIYIREEINCYVMDSITSTRKLSTNSKGRRLFHQYGKIMGELGFSSPLFPDQIQCMANAMDVSLKDIEFMEALYAGGDEFIDASIVEGRSDHNDQTIEADLDHTRVLNLLKTKYVFKLTPKEQMIARRRILTDEPMSVQTLASEQGVSTSSIYQQEQRISKKLIEMVQQDMKIGIAA